MTAFLPSYIPPEIDTLEKLAVWVGSALSNINSDLTVIEATGSVSRAATSAPFYITASDPATWRHITRTSIAVGKAWHGANNQIWNYAQELSTAPLPDAFKS